MVKRRLVLRAMSASGRSLWYPKATSLLYGFPRLRHADRVRWDDNLSFEATRWELLEASLVLVPADGSASVRSLGSGNHPDDLTDIRGRMLSRQRMATRQRMH